MEKLLLPFNIFTLNPDPDLLKGKHNTDVNCTSICTRKVNTIKSPSHLSVTKKPVATLHL